MQMSSQGLTAGTVCATVCMCICYAMDSIVKRKRELVLIFAVLVHDWNDPISTQMMMMTMMMMISILETTTGCLYYLYEGIYSI